jgi:hypothetical protein
MPLSAETVAVVILNYNGAEDTVTYKVLRNVKNALLRKR